jgi:hypothetical protein
MGLRPLDPATWLEPDERRDAELLEKRRLLAHHPDRCVAVVDDPHGAVRGAASELLAEVQAHCEALRLATTPAAIAGTAAPSRHPIELAGRCTQEDWCVHLPHVDGSWRLVAASVCFPTRWDLRSKIGRSVGEIHAPVPSYDSQLAAPVDSFLDRLRPDRPVWRLNWNVLDDPRLHQPSADPPPVEPMDGRQPRWWLRVERQTLRQLPESGAIVFGIRVHVDPLDSLADEPEELRRLERALRRMPPEAIRAKGLEPGLEDVVEAITRILDGRG